MRKLFFVFVIVLMTLPMVVLGQCGTNVLTATDADNIYQSMKVGPHCWMQTNLKTKVPGSRIYISNMYPDTNANLATYGRLYPWAVAAGDPIVVGENGFVRGVCPEGWHIPIPVEVQQLISNGAPATHSIEKWLIPGTNSTGFGLYPGGYYNSFNTRCENLTGEAYLWSFGYNGEPVEVWSDCHCDMYVLNPGKVNEGLSVRCVYKIYQAQVSTPAATNVKAYQANLNGNVVFAGYDKNFTKGFVYGTDMNDLSSDTFQLHQNAEGNYSFKIENLEPNTTYYYKAYVVNEFDTAYGAMGSFTTLPIVDTIALLPNGGQGTMDTMFVTRGDTALNDNAYTHGGNWEFTGWNTEADGSGTHYNNKAALTTNGNVTLHAQWHTWCTGTPKISVNEFGNSRIDSVKDVDNNKYAVVQIGNQCWMKQNLRTTTNAKDTGHIYTPETDGYNVNTYGRLYDWDAVMQGEKSTKYPDSGNVVRGICPEGWHVPSSNEWDTLTTYVNSVTEYRCGGTDKAIAKSLAATMGWNPNNNACRIGNLLSSNNATGFSALPAGQIKSNNPQSHIGFGVSTLFASATVGSSDTNYCAELLNSISPRVGIMQSTQSVDGISVRCVRDTEEAPAMSATTDSATTVTNNSAKLYGAVTSLGDNEQVNAGFCYGQHPDYMTFKVENTVSVTGSYNAELTDISPNTTYYFQAYTATATDTAWAADTLTFTTLTVQCSVNALRAGTPLDGGKYANKEYGADSKIDSVSDHEGNVYRVVEINGQCWLAENMRCTTEPSTENSIFVTSGSNNNVRMAYYKSPEYLSKYGCLYNFSAAMDVTDDAGSYEYPHQGICPEGWHIPTDAEWENMFVNAGVTREPTVGDLQYFNEGVGNVTGGADWEVCDEMLTCPGDYSYSQRNSSGFAALPAGVYMEEDYLATGIGTGFWSSTLTSHESPNFWDIIIAELTESEGSVHNEVNGRSTGLSVRCVRDPEEAPAQTDTIAFLPNGGTNTMDTMFVTRGEEVTIPTNQYMRTGGWQFTGWNTAADGTGTPYDANATFTANGNVTLYAQWHLSCIVTSKRENENGTTTLVDSVSDHQNNWYKVVQIGNQCWMKENMRATTTPGGTLILENPANSYSYSGKKAYYVNGDAANTASYGLLYNWCAAVDTFKSDQAETSTSTSPNDAPDAIFTTPHRGICPEGWHVPTDDEWTTMTDFVHSQDAYVSAGCNETSDESTTFCIAQALSATTGWNSSSINFVPGKDLSANNATGFSALPAGTYFGEFDFWGNSVGFWSITQHATKKWAAYYRSMSYRGSYVNRTTSTKLNGFSVRCVRD